MKKSILGNSVNYDGALLGAMPPDLWDAQRAIYYGDSLFESIRVFNGRIPLMAAHWDRLSGGLKAMRYDVPASWSADFFENEILRTTLSSNARVRLTVWRTPGGLFLPENNDPRFLITAQGLESSRFQWSEQGLILGFCNSVRLPLDALSGFKSLNSARYVAAAQEAHARGWDDGIVLNAQERVCEATSSNLFWFEGNTLCTPPLADGCVTGTMRKILLQLRDHHGLGVQEKSATFATVLAADELFLTNAIRGIRWVRECEGKVYDCTKTRSLFEQVVEKIRSE
ncbi:MAG: aminotransferase class IV [Bacteroidota bacterium]